jgi:curved DNA-binding protein CbpA
MKNYYKILGVANTASVTEIKKAYMKKVKETHPDNNPTDPYANEKMAEVNEAYQILSDPTRRTSFDAGFNQSNNTQPGYNSSKSYNPTPNKKAKDPRWMKGNIIIGIVVILYLLINYLPTFYNSKPHANTANYSQQAQITKIPVTMNGLTPDYAPLLNKLKGKDLSNYCFIVSTFNPKYNNYPPLYSINQYYKDLNNACNNPIATGKAELMNDIATTALNKNLNYPQTTPQTAIQELKNAGSNASQIDAVATDFYFENSIPYPSSLLKTCQYPQIRSGIFCMYLDQIPKKIDLEL